MPKTLNHSIVSVSSHRYITVIIYATLRLIVAAESDESSDGVGCFHRYINVLVNVMIYVTLRLIVGAKSDQSSYGVGMLPPLH